MLIYILSNYHMCQVSIMRAISQKLLCLTCKSWNLQKKEYLMQKWICKTLWFLTQKSLYDSNDEMYDACIEMFFMYDESLVSIPKRYPDNNERSCWQVTIMQSSVTTLSKVFTPRKVCIWPAEEVNELSSPGKEMKQCYYFWL